jgi:hypothetical protein
LLLEATPLSYILSHNQEESLDPSSADSYLTGLSETRDWLTLIDQQTTQVLENRAYLHFLTKENTNHPDSETEGLISCDEETVESYHAKAIIRCRPDRFHRVIVDTGALRVSTGGRAQFSALQKLNNSIELRPCEDEVTSIKFGISITLIIGTATITTPIGVIQFRIVEANTPFLLALEDLKRLRVNIDINENKLVNPVLYLLIWSSIPHIGKHLRQFSCALF